MLIFSPIKGESNRITVINPPGTNCYYDTTVTTTCQTQNYNQLVLSNNGNSVVVPSRWSFLNGVTKSLDFGGITYTLTFFKSVYHKYTPSDVFIGYFGAYDPVQDGFLLIGGDSCSGYPRTGFVRLVCGIIIYYCKLLL